MQIFSRPNALLGRTTLQMSLKYEMNPEPFPTSSIVSPRLESASVHCTLPWFLVKNVLWLRIVST
uniref:Uncharacterized protein n=1 Tax=Oryzias latipes TaxID=8090 RepID=A0A3B3IC84_ORYLA